MPRRPATTGSIIDDRPPERAAEVLLRRRPGRDRRPPGLRARPGRQAASRRPVHRLHRREGADALPDAAELRSAVGRPGQARRDHRSAGRARHRLRRARRGSRASPTPTRSTCSATSPSTRRCARAASGPQRLRSRTQGLLRPVRPRGARRSSTSCWRSTPSTATRSSCCPTC